MIDALGIGELQSRFGKKVELGKRVQGRDGVIVVISLDPEDAARISYALGIATTALLMGQAEQTCRRCGCTEDDCSQCVAKTGKPCHWVEADLCSACVEPAPKRAPKRKAKRKARRA